MTFDQWVILIFSGSGALCINLGGSRYKWGQLLCAVASPCWIFSTFHHGQFGMCALTTWVSACYVYGVYNSFWRRRHGATYV